MNKVYIDKVKVYKRNKNKYRPKVDKESTKNVEPVIEPEIEPVLVDEINDLIETVVQENSNIIEESKVINQIEIQNDIRYNNKVEIVYNGNKRKNKVKVNKNNKKSNKQDSEPVLIDRVFDCVEACVKEYSPRCTDFEIISPDNIPFNSKVEICEAKVKIKIKKICNKIFIQGNEIDLDNDNIIPSKEPNIINLDESLINICKTTKCTQFNLRINEWVEACVEIEICIKGIAYVGESFDEVEFAAVGIVEDEVCIPLMYSISVPNFIGSDNIPYLRQRNSIEAFVDEDFIFLSALPDENANIEKLLGKFVITYCVCSEMESIAPNYLVKYNNTGNSSRPKTSEISREKIIIGNKKRA